MTQPVPATNCRTCVTPIAWIDCPTGGWWAHDVHPADEHDAVPGAWEDGDPLMEAIAAAVWEHCGRDDEDMPQLVLDDPRNIAAAAAAVARTLAASAVVPAADRAAVRDFPLPARAAVICHVAKGRPPVDLPPLLDAFDAECTATALRSFLWRLEQSAGDAAAEKFLDDNPELRRMAVESAVVDRVAAETPPAETLCRCGHRKADHDAKYADPQCRLCPEDGERMWRHAYTPAVEAQPGKDTKPTVGYSGKGRLWCLTCPRPDREDVPMTIDLVCVGELCAGCGRDVIDLARATEQLSKEA